MKKLFQKTFKTPVGEMLAIASDTHLLALEFEGKESRLEMLRERFEKWIGECEILKQKNQVLKLTEEWIEKYFAGKFESLPEIPLKQYGNAFELKVWTAMLKIPARKVDSYGKLAGKIKHPKAARAVGNASRNNPIALIVPCHRVIGSSGKLVGYGGGLPQKKWLLEHEGYL